LWTKDFGALVSPEHERFRGLVSMFGKDPIWASASPDPSLDRSYFATERPYEEGLVLDETPEETVGVVGFEPEFDEQRKLWFCDVELAWKAQRSYYPFIRMALARYQPDSLQDVKLSRVVQTDFAQVVPDRRLTVTKTGDRRFDVTVYGPAPDGPFPNRVEVEIQSHGRIPGELGWQPVAGTADRPNPVVLVRGLPDESWAPEGLSHALIEAAITPARSLAESGARVDLATIGSAVEAGTATEGAVLERALAVEPGVAMHFAAPIERHNLPVVDAVELGHVAKRGVPDTLLPKLPTFLLEGYETWSGSITIPDDAGAGPFRILVCEFETFRADEEVGKVDVDRAEPVVDGPYLDRIVYADIVELPA
jgi:hypothetical protein